MPATDPWVLKALILIPYGVVVAFFLLWIINIYLDGAIGLVFCILLCIAMTGVFMFFAGVNLPILPWQGAESLRARILSWVLMGAALMTPWLVRLARRGTDYTMVKGRDTRAIEQAKEDIERNPTNPAPHVALADIFERQGRLTDAIHQLELALEKAPGMSQARARADKLKQRI
ncbi:MAG: tetratricopeptide repeat protein [Armatimonadota bacterium]